MSIPNSDVRSYFERWENLEDKKDEVATDLKELFAEAKANGHDTKAMRAAFRQKVQMDDAAASKKAEAFDETVGLYLAALIGTVNATRADRAQSSTAPRKDGDGSGAASAPRVNDGDGEPQNSLYPKLEAGTQAPPVETNLPATTEGSGSTGGADVGGGGETDAREGAPADEAEPTQVEASSVNPRRVMSMTPLEPRTAGGLKGFGFTVKFEDSSQPQDASGPVAYVAAGNGANEGGENVADEAHSGEAAEDLQASPASYINPDCAKPDTCQFASKSYLCSGCNSARAERLVAQRGGKA